MKRYFLFTNGDAEIKHREWELQRKETHKLGKILWLLSVNIEKQKIYLFIIHNTPYHYFNLSAPIRLLTIYLLFIES